MTQQTWVADLTIATSEPLSEELLAALDEDGDQYDWYVTPRPDGPGVQVSVYIEAPQPVDVVNHASRQVEEWLAEHGVHGDPMGMRVVTEEQREVEADAPTMPVLVSSTGVAEILGVQRQRVHQLYKQNSRFPAPVADLATGPVWDEKAIEWFNSVWERKPGRPPTGTARGTPKSRGAALKPHLKRAKVARPAPDAVTSGRAEPKSNGTGLRGVSE